MKKALIFITGALLLTACFPIQATQSQDEINTRVAQVLTTFPTATTAPTLPPTATPVPPTATVQPSPTATLEASATPLLAQPTTGPTLNATQAIAATQTAAVASATATFTPNPTYATGDPRSTLGNPTWTDTMDNSNNWFSGTDSFTSLSFSNGEMVLSALSNVSGWRLALNTPTLSSAYIEMTGKLVTCTANDSYGIIFRIPSLAADQGYLFGITCDGQYYLKSFDGKTGVNGTTVVIADYTSNAAIVAGSGKSNRIGVWVKGTTIRLYANGILLKEVTDNTFASGYIGVFIRKGLTEGLIARVTEMDYWVLP